MKNQTVPIKPAAPHWQRCAVSKAEAQAIHAMHANNANAGQQATFMKWLMTHAAPTLALEFDPDSERASAFMAGRRFVGLKVLDIIKTPVDHYEGVTSNG